MQAKWLFPHRYRLVGWLLFTPFLGLGIAGWYGEFSFKWLTVKSALFRGCWDKDCTNNLTDELAGLGLIAGLLLIAFSKERVEDEMISRLRLEALQWSIYANYLVLAIAMLTVYNNAFIDVMMYNMFTVLLVFIGRFRWLLHKHTNTLLAL
jgi:hypothetical protein